MYSHYHLLLVIFLHTILIDGVSVSSLLRKGLDMGKFWCPRVGHVSSGNMVILMEIKA